MKKTPLLAFIFGTKLLIVAFLLAFSADNVAAAEVTFIAPGRPTVPTGSPGWRYRLGASEASSPVGAWRTNSFVEDGSWLTGALPLGYATSVNDPNGYEAVLVTTVPVATTCVFLRKTFVITNSAAYSALTLSVMVDDGLVVWLNGREIMRDQCCTGGTDANVPTFDSLATTANESTPFTSVVVNDVTGPLINGTNVLCIELFNANNTSSDLVFDAGLTATVDDTPPTIVNRSPSAGSVVQQLNSIQVSFSEAVNGVDASDLLINNVPATNVTIASPTTFTWQFAQPTTTGTVNVTFAPGHGITDQASPANPFASDNWTYTLNTNIHLPQFFITEFMAANSGHGVNGIRDEDGDESDWIEIYNSDQAVGNIGGWFLTDVSTAPSKWRIPNGTTIPGRGYLVVFASGKNRTNVLGRLHTNFQLNNSGEYLALSDPQTNVISQFSPTYPLQQTDISYGRDRVDINMLGYYTVPTPGSNNVTSGLGFGPEVHFSQAGGTFADPFSLVLTTDDTNSVIRYTIVSTAQDVGSAVNIPTTASTLYTGPIAITNTVQVRARAFPANSAFFPGDPKTECYVLIGGGATNFVSDLPIVVIHTLGTTTISGGFPALDNSVIIECFDNDGGTSSLNKQPQLVTRAGINYRGSSTQGFPKGGLAVELWDEFNNDEEKSFLGLPKESDWVLYAPNGFDKSLMHNPLLHKFASDMGYYSSRTRFVEVFFRNGAGMLTVNTNATGASMGDYYGVYVLEEKVKRDGNRVNIDKLEPEHTNSATISGGWLVKIDRTDGNERTFTGGGVAMNYQDPDGLEMVPPINPGRAVQAAYITSYFNNMNTGITGNALTNIASTNHYSNYLDVDATIDLNIVMVLTMNVDGYRLSGYINKPRNGKLVFGPVWDVDRGLGTSGNGDLRAFNPRAWQAWDPLGGSDYGTDFFAGTTAPFWLGRWFADVDFWQRWIDRYQYWRTTTLDSNYVASIVDGFGQELRQAQVRESKRWGGNGNSDTNPRTGAVNAGGGVYTNNFSGTFQGEVDFQKRWLIDHINFMDTNLLNRPALNTAQGQVPLGSIVTLTDTSGKPGGSIYYTLDGSDPRAFQGTTNPAAILYTAPITITSNVRIRARAVNANHRNLTGITGPGSHGPVVSSPWSGDIASTYYITPPPLVITELMYNPAPPTSQSDTNEADNFEYIELKNIGSTALNLVGFKFTNGVTFTFTATNNVTSLAPGGYVLIVKNIASFILRYGAQPNIAGQYEGNLDNSGERITLVGPQLEPVLDFTYSDSWYPLTDGLGFSLVIRDENAPQNSWGNAASWRVSNAEGGSPGVIEPPAPALPVVLVNEALTHTDFPVLDTIELFNPGTNAANIGGWYLSDDPKEPKKYQIPDDTMVPPDGFILFDESQFTNGLNGFSLSSEGDELYLFSATNGLLTGYSHGFNFGAAQNGVTFGRYVTSQGDEEFVAQSMNTLGAENALPLVGPVVLSEIMYHPPDVQSGTNLVDNSLDEFIEIHNVTGTNVSLFDALHPTNTWKLSKAVSFDFPTNVSLDPASFALVVNFDPNTNAAQLASFRAKYNVSISIPIFGPYEGKLDNSGETIDLSRPDNPATDESVPYILVDRVKYQDSGVWPGTADGMGASLQRLVVGDYGNDPTNWTAAAASPGLGFSGGTAPVITQQSASATVFVAGSVATSPLYMVGTTSFVAVASGLGLHYQWRFNNAALPDATNATLVLTNIQFSQAGSYSVVAYNAAGSITSSNAQLTVYSPVTIVVQPVNQNVPAGATVSLGVVAIGVGTLHYQWLFEGTDIPGATNLIYSYSNANVTLNGNYACRVQDQFSSVVSSNAFIYTPPVYFTIQPASQNVLPGTNVTINSLALGFGPVRYQWQYEGADIPDATNASYSFNNASLDTHGNYRVVATDSLGTVTSSNAFIFVLLRPGITAQPLSQSVVQGGTAVFSINATGAPPLYFRWLRNGVLWVSNSFPELIIPNCQSNGSFRCQVVNVAGNANSSSVALTVLADFDGDGIPDAWEQLHGFNTNNAADGLLDSDGDGMNNHDEYVAGTDPLDANSVLKIMLSATSPGMLQFVAQASNSYAVQWRTNLSLGDWQKLSNLPPQSQVRTVEWNAVHPPAEGDRFYRVITPLEP